MKTWLWALLAAMLGAAIGAGAAVGQLGVSSDASLLVSKPSGAPGPASGNQNAPSAAGSAKIRVDQETYDFGVMADAAEKSHDFIIYSTGDIPLEIENKGTSCKCAMTDFKTRVIAPGKSTKVTLTWHAKGYFGPYEQSAKIGANDPKRPSISLKVKGRVTTRFRALPPEVIFSEISTGQTAEVVVKLFSYQSDDLKVTDVRLLEPSTAEFFDVTPKSMPAERLREEKDARSGNELVIAIKPGLPLGRFHQTILLRTNLADDPKLEIPVKGKVAGDLTIVGRDWDPERQSLRLGVLAPGEGADRTLLLVVRGRYRRAMDFRVAEVFPPELITAELGDEMAGGMTVRVPLKIHISKHSGPANYLGTKQSPPGHILLKTNHPQLPHITIPISFAIEGG